MILCGIGIGIIVAVIGAVVARYQQMQAFLLSPEYIEYHKRSTDEVVVTFDLHGVIFIFDYKKIFLLLFSTPKTITLLLGFLWVPLWVDIYKLLAQRAIAETYITTLIYKYPWLAHCKKFLFELANAQRPDDAVITMLKTIKKKGYEVHIFSNIGPTLLTLLKARHQALFELFDVIYIPNRDNDYKGKPTASLFHNYIIKYDLFDKTVIFIDNSLSNVMVAQMMGMTSIWYRSKWQLTLLMSCM